MVTAWFFGLKNQKSMLQHHSMIHCRGDRLSKQGEKAENFHHLKFREPKLTRCNENSTLSVWYSFGFAVRVAQWQSSSWLTFESFSMFLPWVGNQEVGNFLVVVQCTFQLSIGNFFFKRNPTCSVCMHASNREREIRLGNICILSSFQDLFQETTKLLLDVFLI